MSRSERLKYLMKAVLGVDVDAIVARVLARMSIDRARAVHDNTKRWNRVKEMEGGLVVVPPTILSLKKKEKEGE